MSLRVVGAGFPRTGTRSLRIALQRLLGGSSYHMDEVFGHLEHVPVWRAALRGSTSDMGALLSGYVAAVDWPASAFWRELSEANPDALVLLSVRDDAETWWRSADQTILKVARREEYPEYGDWLELFHELLEARIGLDWDDAQTAITAYERHNAEVRRSVPPDRLVEWSPREGWGPLSSALDVTIPVEPFPHVNTTEEWLKGSEPAEPHTAAVQ